MILYNLQMIPQKKESLMKTTVASLVGVAPCENRSLTSLEDTDLLPDSLGNLFFVLSVQNSCGTCGDFLNYIELCITRLLVRWVFKHPVEGHFLKKIECFIFHMSTTLWIAHLSSPSIAHFGWPLFQLWLKACYVTRGYSDVLLL